MTRLRLLAEVLVARIGRANAVTATGLVLVCGGFALHVLYQERTEARLQADIESARQRRSLRASPQQPSDNVQRLAAFRAALGAREEVDEHVRRIFESAGRNAVILRAGDYRLIRDAAGGPDRYEMAFPVTASFRAIQSFVGDVLLQLPFAALEKLSIRREAIDQPEVMTDVRLVLFLAPDVPGGSFVSKKNLRSPR